MVKEDSIKIGEEEELEKELQKNSWWSTGLSTAHNREEARLRFSTSSRHCRQALSIGARACRQPEAQNQIQISFSGAFRFLSDRLRIELKFYSLKYLFLKIEGSRSVLNQGNQLLQKLRMFFKHPMIKFIS